MRAGSPCRAAVVLSAVLVVAFAGPRAAAQSRKGKYIALTGLQSLGSTAQSYDFGRYSYGLGSVTRDSPRGEDVLRSTISSPASFRVARRYVGGPQAPVLPELSVMSRSRPIQEIGGADVQIPYSAPMPAVPVAQDMEDLATAVASEYFRTVESPSLPLDRRSEPITSMVFGETGAFAYFMTQGETSFRQGRFEDALAQFRCANSIDSRAPEALISMAQASFATSTYSYTRAGYYLRETLKYFPELALVPLRPRGFYGQEATFVDQLIALGKYAEKHPGDVDASLMQAYFQWFDKQDVKATRSALVQTKVAATRQKDQYTIEAADIFWNGIVATGKGSGELSLPTTQPAGGATTRPAEEAAPAQRAEATGNVKTAAAKPPE